MFRFVRSSLEEIYAGIGEPGSFVRNIMHLSFGTIAAYGIGFLFTPFITRLYSPQDYGMLALMNSMVANLTMVATLCYSSAFIVAKTEKDFFSLARLTLFITSVSCVVILLGLLIFKDEILGFFNAPEFGDYIYFLPLILFLNIIFICTENYNIRLKQFAKASGTKIFSVLSAKSAVVTYGVFVRSGIAGFIIGELILRILTIVLYLRSQLSGFTKQIFSGWNKRDFIDIGSRFKEYPLYIFPSSWLVSFSVLFPVFLLGLEYSTQHVGHFSLAGALLAAPAQLIGFSISRVFFQKSNEIFNQNGLARLAQQFLKIFYAVAFFASASFSLVFVFGELFFKWFAGEQWGVAGQFASYLAISAAYQFIWTVISSVLKVIRNEKTQFWLDTIGSVFVMLVLFVSISLHQSIFTTVIFLSAATLVRYLIGIYFLLLALKLNALLHSLAVLLVTSGLFALSYFIFNIL